jgi:hypothetical protein
MLHAVGKRHIGTDAAAGNPAERSVAAVVYAKEGREL